MNGTSEITLHLVNIHELLRSAFSLARKRILKDDAEEFIVEEAEALPNNGAINLNIHLALPESNDMVDIPAAIHGHFCYRREQAQKEYKRMLQYGWRTFFIALGLLAVLYFLTELAIWWAPGNRLVFFIRESFIILGWVALWRPLDLLLYDSYPIKRRIHLFRRLEHSHVRVI